jgi:mannose-6-phosphate isomerase-like protein (cupin superfamily)
MTTEVETQAPVAQYFHYETPEFDQPKASSRLGYTDQAFMKVQVIKDGGEVTLHSHTYQDGFWMVLKGRAKFYTTDDVVVADLGPYEGIVVPRGFPYWFETAGDEPLEILQFEASSRPVITKEDFINGRVDHTPRSQPRGRAFTADIAQPIIVGQEAAANH